MHSLISSYMRVTRKLNPRNNWTPFTEDGLERDFPFLFGVVSSLFLTALWGPRAPRAWLLRGQSPRDFSVSSLV